MNASRDPLALHRSFAASGLVATALHRFGGDPERAELVAVGANVVHRFEREDGTCYLRTVHAALRSRQEVEAACSYLWHLAASSAPVCGPVLSEGGRAVEPVTAPDGTLFARAVRAVRGSPVGNRCTELAVYHAWGRCLGVVHRAAETFRPSEPDAFYGVESEWRAICERGADAPAGVAREIEELDDWLHAQPRGAWFGLTHGDCNAGNAILDGTRVRMIDFDEPMWCWWAADLVRPLHEVRDRPVGQVRSFANALVAGYREERPLSDAEVAAMPWLLRLKALEIHLWLWKDWLGEEALGGVSRETALAESLSCVLDPLDW
jgi:Ser/Thr protein kinase RdoA (MazF antagonist)